MGKKKISSCFPNDAFDDGVFLLRLLLLHRSNTSTLGC